MEIKMAEEQKENSKVEMSESEKKKEDWMNAKWRPMMGWMYMTVCAFDFIVFPIMFTIVQFWETEAANDAFRQWAPLTLQGAGLFHMAMGAVLGISAYGRTQEKLNGANNGGIQPPTPNTPSAGFGGAASSGFGASSGNFSSAPVGNIGAGTGGFGAQQQDMGGFGQVVTGAGGKPAPIEPPRPMI